MKTFVKARPRPRFYIRLDVLDKIVWNLETARLTVLNMAYLSNLIGTSGAVLVKFQHENTNVAAWRLHEILQKDLLSYIE